jgi:hypothetical protein
MTTDWLLRVGDGQNFIESSKYKIWGIQASTSPHGKYFINNVKLGDKLWFVKSKSQGKIIAVATYCSHNKREIGPLINLTMTNEELGWTGEGPDWTSDVEVHYKDLYCLTECELFTNIKGPSTIRKYDDKCEVNLALEYNNIVRYSKVTLKM